MQTATSETESKSHNLSICVHHYTLRAPCPKGQGICVHHYTLRAPCPKGQGKDGTRHALLLLLLANHKRPCIAVALPFSGDEDKIGGSAIPGLRLAAPVWGHGRRARGAPPVWGHGPPNGGRVAPLRVGRPAVAFSPCAGRWRCDPVPGRQKRREGAARAPVDGCPLRSSSGGATPSGVG